MGSGHLFGGGGGEWTFICGGWGVDICLGGMGSGHFIGGGETEKSW